MITFTNKGIYCAAADVYIDPWKPVKKAILTHAHSDHARPGSQSYLAHHDSASILRYRLGEITLETTGYNEPVFMNGVRVSLHPAGHVQGSAQVRLEYQGETWVISGDYKVQHDGLNVPFEPVPCQHFVTESTFGLPIYNFPPAAYVKNELNTWVNNNALLGYNSVVIGYALGKAQRVLSALETGLPVLLHSAVYNTNEALGFSNTRYIRFTDQFTKNLLDPGIVVAPASAMGSPWLRRFEPYRLAVCSGWMQLRGTRRRSNADKGIAMSDHADWTGLNEAVQATGAENVYVTHGYKSQYAAWLRENYGLNAVEVETEYEGDALVSGVSRTGNENTEEQP